jgi:hypothetical protein
MMWKKIIRGRDPADAAPYVVRWYLVRLPWFRLFLHHIVRPDPGDDLHNHPWPLCGTFVLRGGYREYWARVPSGRGGVISPWKWRARLAWRTFSRMDALVFHRIVDVRPNTWTLFWSIGRREKREWGFLVNGRFVPAEKYLPGYVKGD